MSLIAIAATAVLLAQAPAEPQKKADANQPVTLNGCVVRETASDNSYTFTDNNGLKYRLAGKSVSRYSGLSVEVVGIVDRRNLKVTGGLWPSTNIAAQAGSLDPSKAASNLRDIVNSLDRLVVRLVRCRFRPVAPMSP